MTATKLDTMRTLAEAALESLERALAELKAGTVDGASQNLLAGCMMVSRGFIDDAATLIDGATTLHQRR